MFRIYKESRVVILSGNPGSGKTEFALQYALFLARQNRKVNIVDLDVINVYFRSRENREELKKYGIEVWGSTNFEYNGSDLPAVSFGFESLLHDEDKYLIIDLAGTQNGLKMLMSLQNKCFSYDLWIVCNVYRDETDSVEKIVDLCNDYEKFSGFKVTGLINNSNFLEYTSKKDILHGEKTVYSASESLKIPLLYTMVTKGTDSIEEESLSQRRLYMKECLNRQRWMKGMICNDEREIKF